MASRFGPAQPRGVGWNGAGGWLILSQFRQVNFSRTVWTTFHCRGMTSSVSVTSSPIFTMRSEPQHEQAIGASITTRSQGRCSGNGLRVGRRRSNAAIAVFGAVASALALSSAMSVSRSSSCISSCSISRAWRSALWPYCSRRSLAIWRRRCRIISSEAEITARICVNSSSAADARASASARAARRTAISEAASDMRKSYHRSAKYTNKKEATLPISLPKPGAASSVDCASRCLRADSRAVPPKREPKCHSVSVFCSPPSDLQPDRFIGLG